MALARNRRRERTVDYWPGFVDALSTLLIAIMFIVYSVKRNDPLLNYLAAGSFALIFFSVISQGIIMFGWKFSKSFHLLNRALFYYEIGLVFCLDWLRDGARLLIGDNHWDRLAVFAIIDDLYGHQRDLTAAVLKESKGKPAKEAIEAWRAARGVPVQRIDQLFADLRQVGKVELSMLAVANRALRSVME